MIYTKQDSVVPIQPWLSHTHHIRSGKQYWIMKPMFVSDTASIPTDFIPTAVVQYMFLDGQYSGSQEPSDIPYYEELPTKYPTWFQAFRLNRETVFRFSYQPTNTFHVIDLDICILAIKFFGLAGAVQEVIYIFPRVKYLHIQFVFPVGEYETVCSDFSNLKLFIPKTTIEGITSIIKVLKAVVPSVLNHFKHAF